MGNLRGEKNPRWNGGRHIDHGYVSVKQPNHPRADSYGYVQEHILVAEKVFGRYLPDHAEVHHVNKIKHDNRPENLVICQDRAYHHLLHKRMRAVERGFSPEWMKCAFCKQYDSPSNLLKSKTGAQRQYHKRCRAQYRKAMGGRI